MYLEQEQYSVALRYFARCIQINPEFKEAYYNLGMLYYYLFSYQEAIECLEIYLLLETDTKMKKYTTGFIKHCYEMLQLPTDESIK